MQNYLQEHLNYIYLQEDLKNAAEDVLRNSRKIPKDSRSALRLLDDIPSVEPEKIKKEFMSKTTTFDKYYSEGRDKLGNKIANEKVGASLIMLYAAAKSTADKTTNITQRNKVHQIIDKLFDKVWKEPGKLIRKGAGIWLSSFIILFLFFWLPPMRTIAKTAGKVGMMMILVGLTLSIVKHFFKVLSK